MRSIKRIENSGIFPGPSIGYFETPAYLQKARLSVSDWIFSPSLVSGSSTVSLVEIYLELTRNRTKIIEVHGTVLSTFWSFFKGLMSNECIEKTEGTLRLDFSSDWVKLMVAHVYKQPLELSFDEATGMVLLSNMYLLPELGEIAADNIKRLVDDKTCLEDLLLGWDRSREASHEELKQLFAKMIAKKAPMGQTDLFKGWEEVKLLELYFDTSKVV